MSLLICNIGHVIFSWCSKHFKDDRKLIILSYWETVCLNSSVTIWTQWEAGFSWEQWTTIHVSWCACLHHTEQLSEDASNRPHVNSWTVILLE